MSGDCAKCTITVRFGSADMGEQMTTPACTSAVSVPEVSTGSEYDLTSSVHSSFIRVDLYSTIRIEIFWTGISSFMSAPPPPPARAVNADTERPRHATSAPPPRPNARADIRVEDASGGVTLVCSVQTSSKVPN